MPKFIAIRTCIVAGQRFIEGGALVTENIVPCGNCEGKGKVKGAECPKCKGSARSFPPHHFIEKAAPGEAVELAPLKGEGEEVEMSSIGKLRKAIKELGGDFDRRWKADDLKGALLKLRKEKGK